MEGERHIAVITATPELLEPLTRQALRLPEGARMAGMREDKWRNEFEILIEYDKLPAVLEGARPPHVQYELSTSLSKTGRFIFDDGMEVE